MYYINAKRLVDLAVKHHILHTKENRILVYREAGQNSLRYPEGWYLEDFDAVYQEVMRSSEAQETLVAELAKRGVTFKEYII
mgnify:CR=1 FL=1